MKYQVAHWYGQRPPVPEAVLVEDKQDRFYPLYEMEIVDLHEFARKYGPIILKEKRDGWIIYVTDATGKFGQK